MPGVRAPRLWTDDQGPWGTTRSGAGVEVGVEFGWCLSAGCSVSSWRFVVGLPRRSTRDGVEGCWGSHPSGKEGRLGRRWRLRTRGPLGDAAEEKEEFRVRALLGVEE